MLQAFRLLAAVTLLLLATLAAAVPFESRQTAAFPSPYVDPFYKPPANIRSLASGKVIRRRTVPSTITSPDLKEAVQLLYAYKNTSLLTDATVTTLFVPIKPASPAVILAFNNYEDSTSFDCSPSWGVVANSGSPAAASTNVDQPILIKYALSQGWYVSFADHEGPKAAFIAGHQEGRAILDGIRASRSDQKLAKNTKVLVHGYSGGAHATVWATNLQPSYAPDVNIVGAAHGGTPVDPRSILNFLNGGLFAGFALAGVSGMALAYPELNKFLYPRLTADGKAKVNQFRGPGFCVGQVATAFPLGDIYNLINLTNPLDYPIPKKVLMEESLLREVSNETIAVPTYPRLLYHSLLDEIVPYADEAKYVQESCARGANIQFQTFPIAEHITGQLLGLPGVILFLTQAAAGTTPKVICGTPLPTFLNVFSPGAAAAVGPNVVSDILSLNGKKDAYGQTINLRPI